MIRKIFMSIALMILAVLLSGSAREPEETPNAWKPFSFLPGEREGNGEGKLGFSRGTPEKTALTSPAFAVQVVLDAASPFIPDGRHSLAELSLRVEFSSVTFEFNPNEDPLLGRCQVNAGKGKGVFSKLVLNEVQKGEERVASSFLSARPREFGAGLAIEAEPTAEDEAAARSKAPPEKVQLSFWTDLGPAPITWGSKLGSAVLPDLKIVFDVPFRRLIEGKSFSVTLPYQGRYPEDKGTWRIDIRPKPKAGGSS